MQKERIGAQGVKYPAKTCKVRLEEEELLPEALGVF